MLKIPLIVETGDDKTVWGRVLYDENLIVDEAPTIEGLQEKMKALLTEFHQLPPEGVAFDVIQ